MWVDESGGSDTDAGGADAMTVHVDGQEYQAEVNYDVNEDGVNDTAIVEHDDGTAQAFIDTNHDGEADQYAVLDETGHVVEQAVYDEASGQWVQAGDGGHDDSDTGGRDDGSGGHIHADLPDGEVDAGVATIDTDHDGHNDTAIVETKSGGTIAFTDKDGDGEADIAVQTDSDGTTTTFEHSGPGQWTEVSSGLMDSGSEPAVGGDPAGDAEWGGAGTQTLEGVARIDSGTGQWISPN